jgi:hypothetical protein
LKDRTPSEVPFKASKLERNYSAEFILLGLLEKIPEVEAYLKTEEGIKWKEALFT